jgi:hypothetical protein
MEGTQPWKKILNKDVIHLLPRDHSLHEACPLPFACTAEGQTQQSPMTTPGGAKRVYSLTSRSQPPP